jgi:hypothetical protein
VRVALHSIQARLKIPGRVGHTAKHVSVRELLEKLLRRLPGAAANGLFPQQIRQIASPLSLYGEYMAQLISTTVRPDEEDVRALKRAQAAGHSASELIRKGLRVAASRYYSRRRPPSTRLFESTDIKLGDESELFRDLEE